MANGAVIDSYQQMRESAVAVNEATWPVCVLWVTMASEAVTDQFAAGC